MAKFKIELETDIGRVLLTDFESKNENNLEMTFDESLEEGENDTYTLTFSIPQKIDKIPIGNLIVISRPLWLTFGNPQRSVRMIISAINENRGEKNIIYEVEAQDYASYVYSKNNAGLSFDSFEDEEFLNIMEKKWDAETPPRPEDDRKPEITDIADYLLERGWLKKDIYGWSSEYIRESDPLDPTPQDEYLKYVNIDVDNSNTYNALLELANAAQALIRFDYAGQVVSFIDKENASLDKKFLLREDFNLQELSLSKEGNDLFGILYVDGIQDENDEYTFMEDEIAYRDNFLYDLEYFENAGLLKSNEIQEIRDRFEDDGNPNSLISINVKLEEAIKQRRELEGQIYEAEIAFINLTDTLIVEPTIEDFSKNYDLFWKRFVKTVVDYEAEEDSEVYKYEDFLDVDFVNSQLGPGLKILSAVPFDLNKMLVKINNSYLMFASDTEEETTGTAKVRLATNLFEIRLSTKESVTGFTKKEDSFDIGDVTVSIFVKNDNHTL